MNIKKKAYDAVIATLEDKLASVQSKVARNKWNFKVLAEEQARLKRERGIICNTLKDLNATKKYDRKAQT